MFRAFQSLTSSIWEKASCDGVNKTALHLWNKETLLYLYFLYKKDREEEGAAVSLNSAPQMGKFGEMLKFVFILWRKLVTDSRASVFIIFLLLFSCPRVRTRVGINTPQVNYLLIMSVMKYTSDFFPPLPNI